MGMHSVECRGEVAGCWTERSSFTMWALGLISGLRLEGSALTSPFPSPTGQFLGDTSPYWLQGEMKCKRRHSLNIFKCLGKTYTHINK